MPHGSLEQDEAQLAVLHLLVNCHGVAELLNRHGLQGRGTVQPGQSHAFRRRTNKNHHAAEMLNQPACRTA